MGRQTSNPRNGTRASGLLQTPSWRQTTSSPRTPPHPAPPGPRELLGSEGLSGAQLGSVQAEAQGSFCLLSFRSGQVLSQLPASPKGPRSQVLWVQLCPEAPPRCTKTEASGSTLLPPRTSPARSPWRGHPKVSSSLAAPPQPSPISVSTASDHRGTFQNYTFCEKA